MIVMYLDLDDMDKFDGLTMFTANQAPVIWINRKTPNDRKRFNLAHELGHLVMHLRSEDLDKSEDQKEREANEFAGEFLMPESQCKEDLFNLKYKELGAKKLYWKVSKAAIIFKGKGAEVYFGRDSKIFIRYAGPIGRAENGNCAGTH